MTNFWRGELVNSFLDKILKLKERRKTERVMTHTVRSRMTVHSEKVSSLNFFDKKELNEKSIDSTRSEFGLLKLKD